MLLPVHYAVTPQGNYSDGIHVSVCYVSVAFHLVLCVGLLMRNCSQIHRKKKFAIGAALAVEVCVCLTQAVRPTWLISGMGLTLMTLSFYLALENPDILRAELTEHKMSMLYLKSRVNPHFLYNALDTIRIQAQLNGDKAVADLLMRLVDFFRLSVKVDRRMVALDDELELLEAYTELMCCRYPELLREYDWKFKSRTPAVALRRGKGSHRPDALDLCPAGSQAGRQQQWRRWHRSTLPARISSSWISTSP